MTKRILYIVPHRFNRSPGQRFRCEHFIPLLKKDGFEITYSYMLSAWDDEYFYKKGAYLLKFLILCKAFIRRVRDLFRVHKYDIVFVYREAFMLGTTMFEKAYAKRAALIFDFDDSIWLEDTSEGNQNLAWLKKPQKINEIIALSQAVIVGNEYLASYARTFSAEVFVIPTVINTDYHVPEKIDTKPYVCIGWTGTETTHKHFSILEPVLKKICDAFKERVRIKVISNKPYASSEIPLEWCAWNANTEIQDLQTIDIGIMPLPNDEWSHGKCGFKGLQYMALEIPTVMSPVGVNTKIIRHAQNGFLATSNNEWFAILSQLIEQAHVRTRIGKAGRHTIEQEYSVAAYAKNYIALCNKLLNKRN